MRRNGCWLALAALFLLLPNIGAADEELAEADAADRIELLGGKVERDTAPPSPEVVGIDFRGSTKFSDKYVHLLRSFPRLRRRFT